MTLTLTFEEIHRYFDLGIWEEEDVKLAVTRKKITAEQFKIITGKEYVE